MGVPTKGATEDNNHMLMVYLRTAANTVTCQLKLRDKQTQAKQTIII